jgi:hypothetical protein
MHIKKILKGSERRMSDASNKDLRITKGLLNYDTDGRRLLILSGNQSFCNNLRKKVNISTTLADEEVYRNSELVYSLPKSSNFDYDAIQAIIDLLLQLRAAQGGQDVLVQNNTVLKNQILGQLKNELVNARSGLTRGQAEKLQVVSSNIFDEDTLNNLLKSLLKDSKKKPIDGVEPQRFGLGRTVHDSNLDILHKISERYTKLISATRQNDRIINEVWGRVYGEKPAEKIIEPDKAVLEH